MRLVPAVFRVVSRVNQSGTFINCSKPCLYSTQSKGMYFTKKHEWVRVNDNVGTIGISDYAQESLGEIVFAQLPEVGAEVARGDECGALESVKAAGEVYTPVSGKVTEKNTEVESTPALINKSSYEQGWLFRVQLSKPEELSELMDKDTYDKYVEGLH